MLLPSLLLEWLECVGLISILFQEPIKHLTLPAALSRPTTTKQ